jgi:hypothetical protein
MRGLSSAAMAWGFFERPTGFEIGGDSGRAKHVGAELDLKTGLGGALADHAIGVDPAHRFLGHPAGLAESGAEEGGFACLADPKTAIVRQRR